MPREDLGLRVRGCNRLDVDALAQSLYRKVKNATFHKTDFALALLAQDPEGWTVPSYISEGLQWLEEQVAPPAPVAATPAVLNADATA